MNFEKENNSSLKTDLSDLQGAWSCLRNAVVNCEIFDNKNKLIFHVDEAMSWESVRNLKIMKKSLLVIRNIINQSKVNEEVIFWLEDVNAAFEDSLKIHGK